MLLHVRLFIGQGSGIDWQRNMRGGYNRRMVKIASIAWRTVAFLVCCSISFTLVWMLWWSDVGALWIAYATFAAPAVLIGFLWPARIWLCLAGLIVGLITGHFVIVWPPESRPDPFILAVFFGFGLPIYALSIFVGLGLGVLIRSRRQSHNGETINAP